MLEPGLDAPAHDLRASMQVVHQLRALAVGLNLLGARFAADNDLHTTDLRAIINLLDAERQAIPATPGWLGASLRLNSASVTALVDRLEQAGHVRRIRDEGDRRRVILTVTPSAQALGWAFFGPLMRRIAEEAAAFDDTEIATIHRFLATVIDALPE